MSTDDSEATSGTDYSWVGARRVGNGAEVVEIDQVGKRSRTWFNMNHGDGWRRVRPGEMEQQCEWP